MPAPSFRKTARRLAPEKIAVPALNGRFGMRWRRVTRPLCSLVLYRQLRDKATLAQPEAGSLRIYRTRPSELASEKLY